MVIEMESEYEKTSVFLLTKLVENQQKIIEQNDKIIKSLEMQFKIFSQYDTQYHEEIERSNEIGIPK